MPRSNLVPDSLLVDRPFSVGIIGGGQLGKMLAADAKRMGLRIVVLDPSPDCPAATLADDQIVADFKDEEAIYRLSKTSDVITFEIELANSSALLELEKNNFPVRPSPRILSVIQNKYRQKSFLRENGIPVPDFALIESEMQLRSICDKYGYPAMLKACEDSYDGRGNFVIHSKADVQKGLEYFLGRQCMFEQFVPFRKELSIMVARNPDGQIEAFPLAENIHSENILDTSIVPARVDTVINQKAKLISRKVMKAFGGVGIFGIEMFLDSKDKVLINEIAPRPHNSGHYTNEACSISQFEQHLRCVLNLPLVKPELLSPAAMVNILGPNNFSGRYAIQGMSSALSVTGVTLYVYGKKDSKPRRKLGHITSTAKSASQAIRRAISARSMIKIVRQ